MGPAELRIAGFADEAEERVFLGADKVESVEIASPLVGESDQGGIGESAGRAGIRQRGEPCGADHGETIPRNPEQT
jgi:hypothetical protein